MPYNGSNGTFNRLYNFVADAAAGIKILAARMDAELNGIAAGLSNCITRDGQSPPTADIPMGTKKIVNLGTPVASTDAATKGYVDGSAFLPLAGGTLTGGLSGTTASFSGALSAGAGTFAAPTTTLQDVQLPKLDLFRTGVVTWHVGGSGTAGDNSFNVTMNALTPVISIDTGGQTVTMAAAGRTGGGFSASGMLRATGQNSIALDQGPGVELSYSVGNGQLFAYNRGAGTLLPMIYGATGHTFNIGATAGASISSPGGVPTFQIGNSAATTAITMIASNAAAFALNATASGAYFDAPQHNWRSLAGTTYMTLSSTNLNVIANESVAGILSLGGTALGGISGQVQFNDAAGNTNRTNLSWQGGNEFRITNTQNGSVTTYVNGAERFRVAPSLVTSQTAVQVGNVAAAGALRLTLGDASNSGSITFQTSAGGNEGYISQAAGADINFVNLNGNGFFFVGTGLGVRPAGSGGAGLVAGTGTTAGKSYVTDTTGNLLATIGGQTIGQPVKYSCTPGHSFDSNVTVTNTGGGARIRINEAGGGGGAQMRNTGNALATGSVDLINGAGSVVFSMSADAVSGKTTFSINGTAVFSIDASGNMKVLGTVTPSTTP